MKVPVPLTKVLQEVRKAAQMPSEVGTFAKTILPLLEQGVEELASSTVIRPARGTGKIEYLVQMTEQGEVLTERRLSGRSKPFRCPRLIYDAVTQTLGGAERPLSLDEIVSAVEKKLGVRPADFQLRVPLRLLMHSEPPLLIRSRVRYRAASPKGFLAESGRLWEKLRR